MISLIAAIGKNNELGKSNDLLWKLPPDLQRFKKLTTDNTVIMGRKTYDSIGSALPNRRNIVISRDETLEIEGVIIVNRLEDAIALIATEELAYVIGGGEIYKQALEGEYVEFMEITSVQEEYEEADTFFPEIDLNIWEEKVSTKMKTHKDSKLKYKYTTYVYNK